jgi:hypothetical protein
MIDIPEVSIGPWDVRKHTDVLQAMGSSVG